MQTATPHLIQLSKSSSQTGTISEIVKGMRCEVLEAGGIRTHRHIRGSLPAAYPIEADFSTGPVLFLSLDEGITDPWLGMTLTADGGVIRESTVTQKLVSQYIADPRAHRVGTAQTSIGQVLPLATQRTANYCRWWFDSVSKLFLAGRSSLVLKDVPLVVPYRAAATPYECATLDLLRSGINAEWCEVKEVSPFFAGRALNSPGLTFSGGQRIGALANEYCKFLDAFGPDPVSPPAGAIYVSRNESRMRRVINEDALYPHLEALGVRTIHPASLSLQEQIRAFREARTVIAPHGAGMTNLIFCRNGTRVVEIFPDGGVHGSAFLRLSSHRNFDYWFIVGSSLPNEKSKKNPNNADIVLDIHSTIGFIKDVLSS